MSRGHCIITSSRDIVVSSLTMTAFEVCPAAECDPGWPFADIMTHSAISQICP